MSLAKKFRIKLEKWFIRQYCFNLNIKNTFFNGMKNDSLEDSVIHTLYLSNFDSSLSPVTSVKFKNQTSEIEYNKLSYIGEHFVLKTIIRHCIIYEK